jgi:hypothetical protein
VVGLPINLFGPWHDPDHRWDVASPFMWMGDQVPKEPQPGSRYAQMDLGLLVPPRAVPQIGLVMMLRALNSWTINAFGGGRTAIYFSGLRVP